MNDFQETIIVIPTCRRLTLLEKTLSSLAVIGLGQYDARVVVVENGGGTDARKIVFYFSEKGLPVQYVWYPRPSKSESINFALRDAKDAFVIFFDDDVVVTPEAIGAYIDSAREYGSSYYYGGPVGCIYEALLPEAHRPYVPSCTRGLSHGSIDEGIKIDDQFFFAGHNWACFVSRFWEAGGYDSRLGPGRCSLVTVGDEPELQSRLNKVGCRTVYNPLCRIEHHVDAERMSAKWLLDRAQLRGQADVLLLKIKNENIGILDWIAGMFPRRFVTYIDAVARLCYARLRRRNLLWYLHYYRKATGGLIGVFRYAGKLPPKQLWSENAEY